MERLGIGLIGTGFMGKCHALAYRAVKAVFPEVPTPRLELLCDVPEPTRQADAFGFQRTTADWRDLLADDRVDLVSITTPNHLHHEMAVAALEAGKHVYLEKPMALTLAQAEQMAEVARTARGRTIVGYNYICNPLVRKARELFENGAIGRPIYFRGVVDEDYQADPDLPWTWRSTRAAAGLGALGDLGCHLVSIACEFLGPIDSLIAQQATVHETRPYGDAGERRPVENEDIAAALVRFRNGVQGNLSTSRSAWGRKNYLTWELHGDRGMITFDQERMNELRLYQSGDDSATNGFRRILAGPEHTPYGAFVPAPGHGLGFNDLKTIELGGFLTAVAGDARPYPSFDDALHFERVVHAIAEAAEKGERITIQAP